MALAAGIGLERSTPYCHRLLCTRTKLLKSALRLVHVAHYTEVNQFVKRVVILFSIAISRCDRCYTLTHYGYHATVTGAGLVRVQGR